MALLIIILTVVMAWGWGYIPNLNIKRALYWPILYLSLYILADNFTLSKKGTLFIKEFEFHDGRSWNAGVDDKPSYYTPVYYGEEYPAMTILFGPLLGLLPLFLFFRGELKPIRKSLFLLFLLTIPLIYIPMIMHFYPETDSLSRPQYDADHSLPAIGTGVDQE